MSPIKIGILIFFLQLAAHAETESQAVLPIGALPKYSKVSLQPVSSGSSYFNPANRKDNSAEFEKIENNSLLQVNSITSSDSSSDTADLKALANNKQLVLQKSDLTTQNSQCQIVGDSSDCTITSEVPVYKTGGFDFINWFLSLFGLGRSEKSTSVNSSPGVEKAAIAPNEAMASALVQKVEEVNHKVAPTKSLIPNCPDGLPEELKKDKKLVCGVLQALEAFKKGKSNEQIKKEIFVFNDFSNGGVMGKMWFLNADGSPANVIGKNPIWVSRGEGGFGKGVGSLKTPDGAILTKAFRPPRSGNIKDGIELVGLEPENQDIYSRGVLIHGWDPYTPTQGCLGIAGELDTKSRGRKVNLGGPPPYLDQLKKGLFKDGGVMVYNFTPKKVQQCQN